MNANPTTKPLTKSAKAADLVSRDLVTLVAPETYAVQGSRGDFYAVAVETYVEKDGLRIRHLRCECKSFHYRCHEMEQGCAHARAVALVDGRDFINGADAR